MNQSVSCIYTILLFMIIHAYTQNMNSYYDDYMNSYYGLCLNMSSSDVKHYLLSFSLK